MLREKRRKSSRNKVALLIMPDKAAGENGSSVTFVSWQRDKTGLGEMFVERESCKDFSLLHDDKRNAIGQRVAFVVVLLKQRPAVMKLLFRDVNNFNRGTIQEVIDDLHGFVMQTTTVEKRGNFIENVRRCNEWRQVVNDTFPMRLSCTVMKVIRDFES